ncbi:MAG: T9SS type A sorting domain-containing protein, partial [Ignavibacteria bacterium]|nr:T9SS type A sorting domain-containing protein [Ignavibacteria bacterium]
TKIQYTIGNAGLVSLKVYDVLGHEVAILVNEVKPVGKHRVTLDASNLPAGVYFYRMQAGKFKETRKLILLK